MKQELEKLGFQCVTLYGSYKYKLHVNFSVIIEVLSSGSVYIHHGEYRIHIFPYNYEKLKQLIKILS